MEYIDKHKNRKYRIWKYRKKKNKPQSKQKE